MTGVRVSIPVPVQVQDTAAASIGWGKKSGVATDFTIIRENLLGRSCISS